MVELGLYIVPICYCNVLCQSLFTSVLYASSYIRLLYPFVVVCICTGGHWLTQHCTGLCYLALMYHTQLCMPVCYHSGPLPYAALMLCASGRSALYLSRS